ncbi:MAG: hypothetical protein RLZZ227_653 [Pseudomonadota bacterium]|jgi:hypothetical protein
MVEFALTLPLFLFVVFAVMEVCFVVMDYTRANEVTRELARIAIVHDPVCDIFTPGSGCTLVCPSTASVTVPLPADCGGATDTTGCMMMTSAMQFMPGIGADQIELTYACSNAGAPNRPDLLPLVTVALRDIEHDFMLPNFLGIDSSISIPGFAVTRIGEDMYTEK